MKILAIGAHVDDVELACGGTLARAVAEGHRVRMLVLTESGYGRYDGTVLRTAEEARAEGERAATVLGVESLEILGFSTKDPPASSEVVEAIEARLDQFTPNLIFTHWPHATHQAHRNVGLATLAAARWYPSVLMYEPMMPDGRSHEAFRPQLYSDISAWIERKVEALKAHESQYAKYGQRWVDAVTARCQLRGFEMGVGHAEAFEAVRFELRL